MVFIYESFWFIIQITIPKIKRITNYCNYTIWNCDTGERVTTAKSTPSNRCDTIWNIYADERAATAKSSVSNRCDTIWNIYADERAARRVSIISWLSVLYVLNGRKVTVWILYRYEMAKI